MADLLEDTVNSDPAYAFYTLTLRFCNYSTQTTYIHLFVPQAYLQPLARKGLRNNKLLFCFLVSVLFI